MWNLGPLQRSLSQQAIEVRDAPKMKKDLQYSTIWFEREARKVGNEKNSGWFHYLLKVTKDCVTELRVKV